MAKNGRKIISSCQDENEGGDSYHYESYDPEPLDKITMFHYRYSSFEESKDT